VWQRVYDCSVWDCSPVDRWWHAGLSSDGHRCLIMGACDNHPVIVWDVAARRIVCVLDGPEPPEDEGLDLGEHLNTEGYYVISDGLGAGRYRIFGIHEHHGRTVDESLGVRLEIDEPEHLVRVVRLSDSVALAALKYEWFSGDWAFASFSDDGSMFAVIEPYHVTFFSQELA
jgi:hypothetical protein